MTYQITTLDNGLRVASEFLPGLETVAVNITCGVGARYENDKENGLSHMLEHMAFKGTKTRSARDIAEAFDDVGGQVNAYTSMEMTVYYAKVLKNDTRLAVDILGDIMQNSVFDEKEIKREQDVVLQEIAMHHDTSEDLLVDYFDETMFPDQPLGRSILGTEELVSGFTRDDLVGYMHKHYQTPRMVLSAAGNIDHDTLVKLAKEYCDFPKGKAAPASPVATYVGGDKRVEEELEQLHIAYGLPTVTMHSPHFYTLQVYANILGGGMSSRLFQEVREKRGLVYSVYAMGAAYDDVGVASIYAACAPEKASELSRVLCDQIMTMTDKISDKELTRAKSQVKAELLMSRENPQNIASWIGRHLINYGEYRHIDNISARIDAVSAEDVLTLGRDMIKEKLTVAAIGKIDGIDPYDDLNSLLKC